MNNKNKNIGTIFEINEEEGEYIQHVKNYLFNDNITKPNYNNFSKSKIGKFRKIDKDKLENINDNKPKNNKNIHEGHRKRLRETFNNVNPLTMPEHQILELMISFVQPRKDVNPLAHELLNEFGGLSNVFDASIDDLKKVNGVGEILASFIHFCSKIPAIYSNCKTSYKLELKNPWQIVDYFRSKVVFSSNEEFYLLCLNAQGNVLCFKNLGTGTASKLHLDNRFITSQILKYPTTNVVICHTHPSGSPLPSYDDKTFTLNLLTLLEHLNIKLSDHIIISPNGYFSFFQTNSENIGSEATISEMSLRNKIIFND